MGDRVSFFCAKLHNRGVFMVIHGVREGHKLGKIYVIECQILKDVIYEPFSSKVY